MMRTSALSLVFILSMQVEAAQRSNVTVKVAVMAPPCVINNDQPIDVSFKDVITTAVDGIAYQMPIQYTLSCTGLTSNDLKMMIQGTQTEFDDTAIQVKEQANMGIRIVNAGAPQMVNEWFNFVYSGPASKPALYAVPVKQNGTTLIEGAFTATGSMIVEYQ